MTDNLPSLQSDGGLIEARPARLVGGDGLPLDTLMLNGDYVLQTIAIPWSTQMVNGVDPVTIAGATQYGGIIVTTLVLTGLVAVYDALSATGTPIDRPSLAALGALPAPGAIGLVTGLTVKPTLTGAIFTVLYR